MTTIMEGSDPPKRNKEPYDPEKELRQACAKGIFKDSFYIFCYWLICITAIIMIASYFYINN